MKSKFDIKMKRKQMVINKIKNKTINNKKKKDQIERQVKTFMKLNPQQVQYIKDKIIYKKKT